jgi:Phage integrase family
MRAAGDFSPGRRLRGLIVILWRASLRIHEALALTEADVDARRGSLLVRHGKGGRRREVGMNAWGWDELQPWLDLRLDLPVGPLFCIINGATRGRHWSSAAARAHLTRASTEAGVRRRFAPQVPTRWGKFIDLLALDPQGDLYAIELKRDRTPREVVAQALDYGSWIKDLDYETLVGIYADYGKDPSDGFEAALKKAFGDQVPEAPPRWKRTALARRPRYCWQAWLSRKSSHAPGGVGRAAAPGAAGRQGPQATAVAWRWSLRRLWVAVISRHSVRTAPRPRRLNLSRPRLNFICANTGSIIGWRLR